MRKILPFFIALFTCSISFAQTMKKYPAGQSGCTYYSYCEAPFKVSMSQDSSIIYNGECVSGEVSYGIICVKLLRSIGEMQLAEDMLIAYMDYLKQSFGITKAAGYGKGHHLNSNELTRGVLDYWQDQENNNWKVKGWTDGNYIAVLYAYSPKSLTESKINLFLDGLRLPFTK
ncbi:MAG TPA: hypothetical protein VFV31_13435 [Chitinophagaceae bacterium]|nr:hypothetical protein [Chitinophagaceae bacterium]